MPISGVMHSVSAGGGGGGALAVVGWGGTTPPGEPGDGAVLWNVVGRSTWSAPPPSPWIVLASDGCTAVAAATAAKAKRRATSLLDAIDLLRLGWFVWMEWREPWVGPKFIVLVV